VPERTHFAPLVRGEIGGFAWHLLADLPATKEAATLAYHTPDGSRHRFYMARAPRAPGRQAAPCGLPAVTRRTEGVRASRTPACKGIRQDMGTRTAGHGARQPLFACLRGRSTGKLANGCTRAPHRCGRT